MLGMFNQFEASAQFGAGPKLHDGKVFRARRQVGGFAACAVEFDLQAQVVERVGIAQLVDFHCFIYF